MPRAIGRLHRFCSHIRIIPEGGAVHRTKVNGKNHLFLFQISDDAFSPTAPGAKAHPRPCRVSGAQRTSLIQHVQKVDLFILASIQKCISFFALPGHDEKISTLEEKGLALCSVETAVKIRVTEKLPNEMRESRRTRPALSQRQRVNARLESES